MAEFDDLSDSSLEESDTARESFCEGFDDQDNIETASGEWDLDAAIFHPESDIYQFVEVLLHGHGVIDDEIQDVYEAAHLDTASDGALDLHGDLANLVRETDESDDAYRHRIRSSMRAGSSTATFDEIVEFVALLLETDVDNVTVVFDREDNPAGVQNIIVPLSSIEDSTLSVSDIGDLVESIIPAGHSIQISGDGTFEFSSDSYTPPSGTGFGEGGFGQAT